MHQEEESGSEDLSLGTWSVTLDGLEFRQELDLTHGQFDRLVKDMVAIEQCGTNVFFHALQHNKSSMDGLVSALDSRRRRKPAQRTFTPTGRVLQQRFLVSLTNFLSAARAYFDATSDLLSTTFGKTAQISEEYQASRRSQYDNSPSYRFCEQLRNALQHTAGLPLTIKVARDGGTQVAHRLVAQREELLQCSFNWKAQVRDDLRDGPEEIDIAQAIHTYWQCIVDIEHQRVVRQLAYERPAMERLLAAFQDASLPVDRPVVLLRTWTDAQGESQLDPRFGPRQSDLQHYLDLDSEGRLAEVVSRTGSPLVADEPKDAIHVTPEAEDIMRAWLFGGPSEADRALRECVSSPQTAANAIGGLVNLAGVAMGQVEAVLGLSALEMLESLVSTGGGQN